MARSVCIKIGNTMYCTASPIRDCSCDRKDGFRDPYPETPERVDDPKRALEDVSRILELWSKSGDTAGAADKLYAISAITRLILTPGVDLAGPFVIMSLEDGDGAASAR
jgi:hypothetical protein